MPFTIDQGHEQSVFATIFGDEENEFLEDEPTEEDV